MLKLIYIASGKVPERLFPPAFVDALRAFGTLKLVPNGLRLAPEELLAELRAADVVLTGWGAHPIPAALGRDPGRVRYLLHLTGTMVEVVPLEVVRSGLRVTNWGTAPADSVAEGALCLLLAVLKNLRLHIGTIGAGGWGVDVPQGSIRNLRLGVFGLGAIGRAFCELCKPLGANLRGFDPFAGPVPGVERVQSLHELFAGSDAVAIHVALTPATRGAVNAEMLALLPDHGVLVNTARGGIVDQEALWKELAAGRLRAGLDVLVDDFLESGHPARSWPNLIITSHQVGRCDWPERGAGSAGLGELHVVALENLRRFVGGEPLLHVMTPERYAIST